MEGPSAPYPHQVKSSSTENADGKASFKLPARTALHTAHPHPYQQADLDYSRLGPAPPIDPTHYDTAAYYPPPQSGRMDPPGQFAIHRPREPAPGPYATATNLSLSLYEELNHLNPHQYPPLPPPPPRYPVAPPPYPRAPPNYPHAPLPYPRAPYHGAPHPPYGLPAYHMPPLSHLPTSMPQYNSLPPNRNLPSETAKKTTKAASESLGPPPRLAAVIVKPLPQPGAQKGPTQKPPPHVAPIIPVIPNTAPMVLPDIAKPPPPHPRVVPPAPSADTQTQARANLERAREKAVWLYGKGKVSLLRTAPRKVPGEEELKLAMRRNRPQRKREPYRRWTSPDYKSRKTLYNQVSVNAEQIQKAIPVDASCVFHILDRRINFDAFDEDASFYSLLRAWVQDDPYRYIPPTGGNLMEYVTPQSQVRTYGKEEKNARVKVSTVVDESSDTRCAEREKTATIDLLERLKADEESGKPKPNPKDLLVANFIMPSKRRREQTKKYKLRRLAAEKRLRSMGIDIK
jgi:hypothetical protein